MSIAGIEGWTRAALMTLLVGNLCAEQRPEGPEEHQYHSSSVSIPRAHAGEPRLEKLSLKRALEYLDQGAQAWTESRGCLSCHTNGVYVVTRPALTARFGPPPAQVRVFLKATLERQLETTREQLSRKTAPAQAIHTPAGLAEWDAHGVRTQAGDCRDDLESTASRRRLVHPDFRRSGSVGQREKSRAAPSGAGVRGPSERRAPDRPGAPGAGRGGGDLRRHPRSARHSMA